MSAVSEALMRRLYKIKALAERGVDGEQAAAQAMLENILTRHNLTLADIEDTAPAREWVEVKFVGKYEEAIMVQLLYKVRQEFGQIPIKRQKGTRGRFHVQLSAAEQVEVEFLFELMRKALADEFDKVLAAFIHRNQLYGPRAERNEDEEDAPDTRTPEERMRHRQIANMAMFMEPVNVRKAISE